MCFEASWKFTREAPFPTLGETSGLKILWVLSQLLLELMLYSQFPFESLDEALFALFLEQKSICQQWKIQWSFGEVMWMAGLRLRQRQSSATKRLGQPKWNTNALSLMLCNLLKIFYICSIEQIFTVVFISSNKPINLLYCHFKYVFQPTLFLGGYKLVPCFFGKMRVVFHCLPFLCIMIFIWLFSSKRRKSLQNTASFLNFIETLYLEYFLI